MASDVARTFETAISALKQTVSASDAHIFQSTSSEDIWKAVEEIQAAQRKRRSIRNMRRIEPFLKGLEKYSKTIEVLCNGTPYLPWIWAPIKLMLQLADEYTNAFDKLLEAYAEIGQVMPQLDRVGSAFSQDPNVKIILGLVYSDILEFHRRAYKYFRRRSWEVVFDICWKSFDFRFQGILRKLSHHRELLMRELLTIDVIEAHNWRTKSEEEVVQQERKNRQVYLHDSIAWLKVAAEDYDDELDKQSQKRQEGTCEWIFGIDKYRSWKDDGHVDPILWVEGIPGAGKTILSTYIIQCLQEESGFITAYHICNSYTTNKNLLGELLRSIAAQLLRGYPDIAPFVFENYANKALTPSVPRLKNLLPELLQTMSSVRIIIDGLDEYPEKDQRLILTELLLLTKNSGGQCRILLSNRPGEVIDKVLRGKPTISLKEQNNNVEKDIEAYIKASLEEARADFGDHLINKIEKRLVKKANGMFLWVRLVIDGLKDCKSQQELLDTADSLPEGLDQAYDRILHRIMKELNTQGRERALSILEWIACSFRLMKAHEVQDGILFLIKDLVLDDKTKLISNFWHMCKPLIEEGSKNTIDFVHYSAKEYILHKTSGPFLHSSQAHYHLAFSCINYLNSSICFIDPDISKDSLAVRVVRGSHGLHHYAHEFWFQHLLQYARYDDSVEDDALDEMCEEIREFWKDDPGQGSKNLKLEDTTSTEIIQRQLGVLDQFPQAKKMGIDLLTFQKFLAQERYSHQDPEVLKNNELKYDPTHFSQVSWGYQDIVRSLIHCSPDNIPAGIDPIKLEQFKRIYMDSAFICRYRECQHHFDGFKSSSERDEHEKLHAKPLRCADPLCIFFAKGFTSKTGLLKHNRKYHPLPDEVDLPHFEPRREPDPEPEPEPEPVPIPPPPPPLPPTIPVQNRLQQIRDTAPKSKRTRVSRALKGKKVHNCGFCSKVYTRAEGLRRHQLCHAEPQYICSHGDCGRAFFREDLLERHASRHQSSINSQGGTPGGTASNCETSQPPLPPASK